jgi:hypothetical protein
VSLGSIITNFSSSGLWLLVVADDRKDAWPIVVKNITSPGERFDVHPLMGFGSKNFCAAYSPISNIGITISNGTVALANCSHGEKVDHIDKTHKFDTSNKQWRNYSLADDDYRALALDKRGKLLIIYFTSSERSGTM